MSPYDNVDFVIIGAYNSKFYSFTLKILRKSLLKGEPFVPAVFVDMQPAVKKVSAMSG